MEDSRPFKSEIFFNAIRCNLSDMSIHIKMDLSYYQVNLFCYLIPTLHAYNLKKKNTPNQYTRNV